MCYKRPVSKENEKGLLAEFGGPFQLCHSLNFLQGLWARKKSMSLLKGSSAFLLQTINDASMPIHFPYKNLSWCKHSFPSWPLFLIFLLFIFICLKVFQVSESLGVDDRMEAVELGSGIKPLSPEGNQPWIFIGRRDAEAEAPILWPPDVKSRLIGKDPDSGKDWGQEEKRVTEAEIVRWHHLLNGHEFQQAPGDSEGQGSLACCSSWGRKDWDTT